MKLYTSKKIHVWTLEKRLGVGGEGEVWSGFDDAGSLRALKFSSDQYRLRAEFDTLKSLSIDGIVKVHDFHTLEGWAYFEMEFIDGIPLVEYLQSCSTAERYHECIHLLVNISNILAQLHQRGLMHLDIKSENLLVTKEGKVTIIDFGKVGIIGDHSTYHKGTHATMSPEQRVDQALTEQSDVYSLSVTVFQALMDTPPPYSNIGMSWPSLLNTCADVEQSFDGLMQQCLHLVPILRPTMHELHDALCALQLNSYRPKYYRISTNYIGTLPQLLNRSVVLTGMIGSGRKRIIRENIRLAYLEGVQSVIATASPTEPFGLWKQILLSILTPLTSNIRHRLLKETTPELAWVIPEFLAIESTSMMTWDLTKIGTDILQILHNVGPINVVLLNLEDADPASAAITKMLFSAKTDKVTLWCTATNPVKWASCERPPKWTKAKERELLIELLPFNTRMPDTPPARTPLQSSIKAWHWVAQSQSEPCLLKDLSTTSIAILSLLKEPFPISLAQTLTPSQFEHLSNTKVLDSWNNTSDISFSFLPFRTILKQSMQFRNTTVQEHIKVMDGWHTEPPSKQKNDGLLLHSLLSNNFVQKQLIHSLWYALLEMDKVKIMQLWMLSKMHAVIQDSWILLATQAFITIEFYAQSAAVHLDRMKRSSMSPAEKIVFQYIQLLELIHEQEYNQATRLAEQLLIHSQAYPHITLSTYREVAWIYLKVEQFATSIDVSMYALNLGYNDVVPKMALSLHLTMSAAYLASCKSNEALQTCQKGLLFARKYAIQHYYIAALHTNAGLALLQKGERSLSRQSWITIRQLPDFAQHLDIRLHCMVATLRLQVESGNGPKHLTELNDAIDILKEHNHAKLLGESAALLLECATQSASARLAKRAFQTYAISKHTPLFDISHARWLWLTGHLEDAWKLLKNQPTSFEGFAAQAEQVRLGIVLGKLNWAKTQSDRLLNNPLFRDCKDLYLFVTLCHECIHINDPAPFLYQDTPHNWAEIELVRNQLLVLRNHFLQQPIKEFLQRLQHQALEIEHRLYLALSNPDLYTTH